MYWFSKSLPTNGSLRPDSINLELSRFRAENYTNGTFQVFKRGSNHEVSLLLNESHAAEYLPKSNQHYKIDHAPAVIRIVTKRPIATNTNTGSPFKFNSSLIPASAVTFDGNYVINIAIKDGLGISDYTAGHYKLYPNSQLRYIDGSLLEIEPWSVYISKDLTGHNATDCCEEPFNGVLKLYTKAITTDTISNSLKDFKTGAVKVLSYSFIPNDIGSTAGWLYILYASNESLDIQAIEPVSSASIANGTNTLSITFNKPIIDPGGLAGRLTVSHSDGVTYYPASSYVLYDSKTLVFTLPSQVNTEGIHHVKFDGTNIYSKDGDYFRSYAPVVHSCYFRINNRLGDLSNVTDTGSVTGPSTYTGLITDGVSWYPAVLTAGISTGAGAPTDATYVTLTTNGSLSNERVLTAGNGILLTDSGAGSTLTVRLDTGALGAYLGTGDVRGPASATANGIATYNGTSGKLLKSVAVTLDDAGEITAPGLTVNNDAGFRIIDGAPANYLRFSVIDLTAERELSIDVQDADRTLTIAGDATISGTNSGDKSIIGGVGITVDTGANSYTIHATDTGGSGGAPVSATYLTLSTNGTLEAERVFTPGIGLSANDAGPGSTYTLNFDTGILTGYVGTGGICAAISGCLTGFATGTDVYNLTQPSYLTLATSATLANERVFTVGTGLTALDGGANGTFTVNFDTGILTGYALTGNVAPKTGGYLVLSTGNTNLSDERRFIAGTALSASDTGPNGTYTLNVNQSVIDHGTIGGLTDDDHSIYITTTPAGSRNIIQSPGDSVGLQIDSKFISTVNAFEIVNDVRTDFTVDFAGTVKVHTAFDGNGKALGNIADGVGVADAATYGQLSTLIGDIQAYPYITYTAVGGLGAEKVLTGGTGIALQQSGNFVYINSTGSGSGAPTDASYLVLGANATLSNERTFTIGSGLASVDGGANGAYTINFDTGFLTGNITTGNFLSYVTGGTGITVTYSGQGYRIDSNSVPCYAQPWSYNVHTTSATAAGSTVNVNLSANSTVIRNPLMSGELLVVTRAAIRANNGATVGTYRYSGGLTLYPNLVGGAGAVDYFFVSCTGTQSNNSQNISTGYSYYRPLLLLTGTNNSSYNVIFKASNLNPAAMGATGHTLTLQGYIVYTGAGTNVRYP